MSLMLRSRNSLARIFRQQGLLVNAYYILKQALVNFKSIAEGWSNDVENGAEPKDKGSFELPEMFGGSQPNPVQAGSKGGKAQPPPAAAKGKLDAKGKAVADPGAEEAAQKALAENELKRVQEQQQ